MAVYGQNMAQIDPESCQLVEVPVDANGAIVVQDPSGLIAGTPVQVGSIVQTGKSVLKPELAQHLIQPVGLRQVMDQRVPQAGQRNNRTPARKPLGSNQGMQVLQGAQLIQQPAVIAPTASGLLSLGTRYTPSSGIPLTVATGGNAPTGIITSQGNIFTASGTTMVTSTGTGVDRDGGYRFAAVAGTSNRGRPRGRRPLRGQFPVVPIDMVRQLGIEQQVILQPAAPVAMRNKAILCRPLSVSRKTQAGVNYRDAECQFSAEEEALASKQDDEAEEDEMMVVEERQTKKDAEEDLYLEVEEEVFSDSDGEGVTAKKGAVKKIESSANTEVLSTSHLGTQTDVEKETKKTEDEEKEQEQEKKVEIKYVPLPIPVPIYIPVPVFTFAKPLPIAVPFPLPFAMPMPILMDAETVDKINDVGNEKLAAPSEKPEDAAFVEDVTQKPEPETVSAHGSNSNAVSTAATAVKPQKRPARDSLASTAAGASAAPTQPSKRPRQQAPEPIAATPAPAAAAATSTVAAAPATARRPAAPILSDANYHLKFSYGINAWRLWVNQTHQTKVLTDLVEVPDTELNAALTRFVREVRKPNNEPYVADSIFYLCLGIQEFLNENGRRVNIFGEPGFESFANALDTVLADFRPRISAEGMLICRIEEEHMWEAKQLGNQSPHILLFSLLYFFTKHMWLRTGSQHAQLRHGNFKVKREGAGSECLLFVQAAGGADSYRMFSTATDAPSRCPVQLFRHYVKKCPQSVVASGGPFYLGPLVEPTATQWFSETPLSAAQLQVMVNRIKMVKEIQEAFMDSQAD